MPKTLRTPKGEGDVSLSQSDDLNNVEPEKRPPSFFIERCALKKARFFERKDDGKREPLKRKAKTDKARLVGKASLISQQRELAANLAEQMQDGSIRGTRRQDEVLGLYEPHIQIRRRSFKNI